ncbi:MAG TPA: TetR/AcrR family transcriptional regulator [Solirubrobacteraceae bacterium]
MTETTPQQSARDRILDAAVARIAREGIDDVRVARIAMDAGVSAALVHYHFDSREALLAEALEHSYELIGDVRIGGPAGDAAPVAERLVAMIDSCLPEPGAQRDDWLLWVELWLRAGRRPELRETAAGLYVRMHDWFREALDAGVAAGELAAVDTAVVADRLLALIDGYGLRVLMEDPAVPLARARAEIWAAVAGDLGLPAELPR